LKPSDHPVWLPLKIHSALANTDEDIARNIEHALGLDYIPFNDLMDTKSGAVAIVGSGPSLKANWRQLKKFPGDIMACNAACQFLLERDVIPKYMMCFDADPLMLEFVTPHPEVTYLLASRCPPESFDLLKGQRIVCWHAAGDTHIQDLLEKRGKMEPMVIGGSAAVTRAMILSVPIGYREIHLYGADSSFHNGDTHIRKSTTVERRMQILCNKRVFECAPWMAQQAEDFKFLAPMMTNQGVTLHVHGDGLIPHLAIAMGYRTDLEPRAKQFAREWKWKAKTLWSNL